MRQILLLSLFVATVALIGAAYMVIPSGPGRTVSAEESASD
jgi:hypothetical protein